MSKQKKERSDKYEKKLKIEGSFDDVLKASVSEHKKENEKTS